MKAITVRTTPNYVVQIGKIDKLPDCAAVITDDRLAELYPALLKTSNAPVFAFENGEKSKNLETLGSIWEFLAKNNVTRTDTIIAFGGGVVGDIAGFAAATYLRGVKYIQVPTTLLAMIDSSVGGKTAIDLSAGKNLAGVFYQPAKVLIDTSFLNTQGEDNLKNGLGEVIKTAAIADEKLFGRLEKGAHVDEAVIADCVQFKANVVAEDPEDRGLRQILNFGHTFAHVIEKHSAYAVPHGQAVGMGMVKMLNYLNEPEKAERIKAVLEAYGLRTDYPLSGDALFSLTQNDKKRKGKTITLVGLEKIGKAKLIEDQ
jgi:3-dehydroquinate synthase